MEGLEEILSNNDERSKLFDAIKSKGFDIFDEAKKNDFIKNVTEEEVKKAKFAVKSGFDNDLKELTGIEKGVTEKTHEYIKRVTSNFMTETQTLKEKLESGINADEAIKQVQQEFAKKEAAYLEQIEGVNSKFTNQIKESKFNDITKGLSFDKNFDADLLDLKLNQLKSEYLNQTKADDNGNLILIDEKGEPKRNPNNNMNPFTLNEVLTTELDKYLDKGRKSEGGGTKPPASTDPKLTNEVPQDLQSKILNAGIKNEGDLLVTIQKHMKEQGKPIQGGEVYKTLSIMSKQLGL